MKNATELNAYFNNIEKTIVKKLITAQREVAEEICQDAQNYAPGNGEYSNSIKVRETKVEGDEIITSITTDVTVTAKSNGNVYNLGFLLEHGTSHHAIPNAFDWGRIFGYDSDMYKRTLDPHWHPGFDAMPHFSLALIDNKDEYSIRISKVLDEEFK